MKTVFEYKGYIGSAEVDVEGGVLFGKLLYIRDTITYTANTVEDLRTAFHAAVDDYLVACVELGDEPEQPLKGSFNVRVGAERHRKIAIEARRKDMGLNEYVCWSLDYSLEKRSPAVSAVQWANLGSTELETAAKWETYLVGGPLVLYENAQRVERDTASSTTLATVSTSPTVQ